MQQAEIAAYIASQYHGLVAVNAWGEQSFFYNPKGKLPRGVYFATLKDKDGANDKASALDRDGIFRLNFGVSKPTYERTVGARPVRPAAGGVVNTGHDFTQLQTLMPHPVYGWMSWLCILNPDTESFAGLKPLLDESYTLVVQKYNKRVAGVSNTL